MPKKRFSAEQVVTLLRQIEVLIAQGKSAPVACREAGISQQNFAMSCSTAKSSTASRKHRSSSSNGASTTTRSDRTQPSDIDHPRHKRSTRSCHRWIRRSKCNNLPISLVQKSRQANAGLHPTIVARADRRADYGNGC